MTDTPRTQSQLLSSDFQDGQVETITAQKVRNLIVTIVPTSAVMTSGASITMTTTILRINKTSGSATAVTLPTSPVVDTQIYVIKDLKGDASTNNITITSSSGSIDGASSYVINSAHQAVSLQFDGTNWSLI